MAKVAKARETRVSCGRCNWRYWQEPQPTDDGKIIMVWKQEGEPCDACLEEQFKRLHNRCADGRCNGPRDCPKHAHLYERPSDWPTSYPKPEAVTSEEAEGRKSIAAYHRGSKAEVEERMAKREAEREAATVILPMVGKEAEEFWGTLNARLGFLSQPENLTQMARRILVAQIEEGHRASAYGEGLNGTIPLDTNPEERLEALERRQEQERQEALAKLTAEQSEDAGDYTDDDYTDDDYTDDDYADDDEDAEPRQEPNEPDDDTFDLDVLLQAG